MRTSTVSFSYTLLVTNPSPGPVTNWRLLICEILGFWCLCITGKEWERLKMFFISSAPTLPSNFRWAIPKQFQKLGSVWDFWAKRTHWCTDIWLRKPSLQTKSIYHDWLYITVRGNMAQWRFLVDLSILATSHCGWFFWLKGKNILSTSLELRG